MCACVVATIVFTQRQLTDTVVRDRTYDLRIMLQTIVTDVINKVSIHYLLYKINNCKQLEWYNNK